MCLISWQLQNFGSTRNEASQAVDYMELWKSHARLKRSNLSVLCGIKMKFYHNSYINSEFMNPN